MKTTHETQQWGIRSVSFWMVFPVALGIILVGVAFIVNPSANAVGYGIHLNSSADFPYGRIKGIRDIFSGIALLLPLFLKLRKAAAWVFTAAIIIPATDCLIILNTNGPSDLPHVLLHGLTALYMIITSYLLFKDQHTKALKS
ncbi:MAG TPA: DUF4267 domain-containing protein [Mucilaginibacter sp.]|jgi:hypothetical protein